MHPQRSRTVAVFALSALILSGCGGSGSLGSGGSIGSFGGGGGSPQVASSEDAIPPGATDGTPPPAQSVNDPAPRRRGLFGGNSDGPVTTIQVNKYIWAAALDVLSFLPVQSADPFTGVIVTGYGTPPGGGRAYRATIFVQDPALDARSLRLALQTRSGPVSTSTANAVEDAILTRARQLRVSDGRL